MKILRQHKKTKAYAFELSLSIRITKYKISAILKKKSVIFFIGIASIIIVIIIISVVIDPIRDIFLFVILFPLGVAILLHPCIFVKFSAKKIFRYSFNQVFVIMDAIF